MSTADTQKEEQVPKKKVVSAHRATTTLKKVDLDTSKLIAQIKEKVNKKNFGRKVRDAEIISLAVRQLTPDHIKELQDATLSENDRLRMLHEDYQREHGKITLDKFIGLLIRGQVKTIGSKDT